MRADNALAKKTFKKEVVRKRVENSLYSMFYAVPRAVVADQPEERRRNEERSNRKRLIRRSISGVFRVRWSSKDREYGLACYEIGFDAERFICRVRRGLDDKAAKIEYPSAICKVVIRLRLCETPVSILQACLPRRFCGVKARFFDSPLCAFCDNA